MGGRRGCGYREVAHSGHAAVLGLVAHGDDILCAVHSYRVNKAKNIAMRFFHASSVL